MAIDDATHNELQLLVATLEQAGFDHGKALDTLNALTREAVDTRPSDWVLALRYGFVTLHQPLEGGPVSFRPIPGRATLHYHVRPWLLPLLRALWARLLGRWASWREEVRT